MKYERHEGTFHIVETDVWLEGPELDSGHIAQFFDSDIVQPDESPEELEGGFDSGAGLEALEHAERDAELSGGVAEAEVGTVTKDPEVVPRGLVAIVGF